jgi:hypothetical protein
MRVLHKGNMDMKPILFTRYICISIAVTLPIVCFVWFLENFTRYKEQDTHHEEQVTYKILERIPLQGVRDSFRLEYVREDNVLAPQPHYIRAVISGKSFFLNSLKNLDGLVAINNTQDALRFVRICSDYFDAMPCDYEKELPKNFDTYVGQKPLSGTEVFRQFGVIPAQVTTDKNGFVILRWVYVQSGEEEGRIQQRLEYVSKKGRYQRKILKEIPPPNIPGISLRRPGLM